MLVDRKEMPYLSCRIIEALRLRETKHRKIEIMVCLCKKNEYYCFSIVVGIW